jgi:2-aminoethylphosphonate-pyruvate transaminase
MAYDYGSRDPAFLQLVQRVLAGLAELAPDPLAFVAVPLQGSGTFAVEGMLGSLVPVGKTTLVLNHGVYGARAAELLKRMGRSVEVLSAIEGENPDLSALEQRLAENPDIRHVFTVHSETTTGQLLPLFEIATVVARQKRRLLVDAMSSLGAVALELPADHTVDAIASSANKCLEGVPGLAFVLVRRSALAQCRGNSPSLSLDLFDQAARLERDTQFRFTPPVQVIAALDVALKLHRAEGGVAGRGARYRENMRRLIEGMTALGYRPLLPSERQGPIIATFHIPDDPQWNFSAFYDFLGANGFLIYPGSLAQTPSFRVGCIGQVFPADIDRFLAVVARWSHHD